jgi:hypothetical protein
MSILRNVRIINGFMGIVDRSPERRWYTVKSYLCPYKSDGPGPKNCGTWCPQFGFEDHDGHVIVRLCCGSGTSVFSVIDDEGNMVPVVEEDDQRDE